VPGAVIEIAGVAGSAFTAAGTPGLDVGVLNAFTYNGGVAAVQ
jgi:hypothetical protein